MTQLPHKFCDLPADSFPFTIAMFRESDDEEVFRVEVTGPGAVRIPGLANEHGDVYTKIFWPDGEVGDSRYPR